MSGKRVYHQNCVFCHEDNMEGDGIFAHGFNPISANSHHDRHASGILSLLAHRKGRTRASGGIRTMEFRHARLDKLGVSPSVVHCLYWMELYLRTVSGRTEVLPDPPKVQIRLYSQPEGRAFLADFRSRGRRRSSDRLTSTRTKLHQELLRALPKDLRRAYLGELSGGRRNLGRDSLSV